MATLTLHLLSLRHLPPLFPLGSGSSSSISSPPSLLAQCDLKPPGGHSTGLAPSTRIQTQRTSPSPITKQSVNFNQKLTYDLPASDLKALMTFAPKIKVHVYTKSPVEALGWVTLDLRDMDQEKVR